MEASGDRTETRPTVLVAIEPRSYREVIGKAIGMLRPALSVEAIESGMLDAELSRTKPILMLCNEPVEAAVDGLPNRVMFGGNESDSSATVHVDGGQSEVERLDLDGLLRIVDRVVSSTQGSTQDESKTSENKEQ